MLEEKFENLKNMVDHINGEIEVLENKKIKTIESIDTFNGENEKGDIIKLELFTVLHKKDSKNYCYEMYHKIDNLDSDLIDAIKKYFQKRLSEINSSLEELKEEKNKILGQLEANE